jgi:hypothetical protein
VETATESVHLVHSRNYKLFASVGISRAVLFPVRAVLDTGTGPNIVREDILPRDSERWQVPNLPLPRINNASGKQNIAKGVIVLKVQLENYGASCNILCCPRSGGPVYIGLLFY